MCKEVLNVVGINKTATSSGFQEHRHLSSQSQWVGASNFLQTPPDWLAKNQTHNQHHHHMVALGWKVEVVFIYILWMFGQPRVTFELGLICDCDMWGMNTTKHFEDHTDNMREDMSLSRKCIISIKTCLSAEGLNKHWEVKSSSFFKETAADWGFECCVESELCADALT